MIDLSKAIEPLNRQMWEDVRKSGFPDMDSLTTFTALAGSRYPEQSNRGIVFYGRANNGWDDTETHDVEKILFDQTFRPFFNLIYYFGWEFYGNDWNKHVAWSNICKLVPWESGNPSDALWDAQYNHMVTIIKKEMELLSPALVVLVTGNTASARWDSPFFDAYPHLLDKMIDEKVWYVYGDKKCTASLYSDGLINVLLTDRPERRPIQAHSDALFQLVSDFGLLPTLMPKVNP